MLKAITLSVLTANVNSAAYEPLLALYEVPSSIYNTEVRKLISIYAYFICGYFIAY